MERTTSRHCPQRSHRSYTGHTEVTLRAGDVPRAAETNRGAEHVQTLPTEVTEVTQVTQGHRSETTYVTEVIQGSQLTD